MEMQGHSDGSVSWASYSWSSLGLDLRVVSSSPVAEYAKIMLHCLLIISIHFWQTSDLTQHKGKTEITELHFHTLLYPILLEKFGIWKTTKAWKKKENNQSMKYY